MYDHFYEFKPTMFPKKVSKILKFQFCNSKLLLRKITLFNTAIFVIKY